MTNVLKKIISNEFNLNDEYIDENVNVAEGKLALIRNLINQLINAAEYATHHDINLLSSMYDADIMDSLEDISDQLTDVEGMVGV